MSISTVITLGYGSFGTTGFVITLGYGTSGVAPPTPTPTQTQDTGAGRGRGKRKRLRIIFRINGEEVEANSLEAVLEIIKEAKKEIPDLAREKAQDIVLRGVKLGTVKKEDRIEVVSAPAEVRSVIEDRIREMERFYWARINSAMRQLEDEEEDVWILL